MVVSDIQGIERTLGLRGNRRKGLFFSSSLLVVSPLAAGDRWSSRPPTSDWRSLGVVGSVSTTTKSIGKRGGWRGETMIPT